MKKDLGVKIGTKEQSKWEQVLKRAEETVKNTEIELAINKNIIEFAKQKVEEEKEKLK